MWKLSSAGSYQWAKVFGGSSSAASVAREVAIDPSGNVVVAGSFVGAVDFQPAKGTLNLPNAGAEDIYIAKLTSAKYVQGGSGMPGAGGTQQDTIKATGTGATAFATQYQEISTGAPGSGRSDFVITITVTK